LKNGIPVAIVNIHHNISATFVATPLWQHLLPTQLDRLVAVSAAGALL
jgi:hypothetical protein